MPQRAFEAEPTGPEMKEMDEEEKKKLQDELIVAVFDAGQKFKELEVLFVKIGRKLTRLRERNGG